MAETNTQAPAKVPTLPQVKQLADRARQRADKGDLAGAKKVHGEAAAALKALKDARRKEEAGLAEHLAGTKGRLKPPAKGAAGDEAE